jgi:uncharacterized protein YgbK (DUF1537 family)
MTRENALQETKKLLDQLIALQPSMIFKKTDSVLRGYVSDELKLQLELQQLKRILFLPSNPSLGRNIKKDIYYINGKPIADTDFSNDPEFPVSSSSVTAILNDPMATLLPAGADLPDAGFFVAEAADTEEVENWASKLDGQTLAAGAGDFFTAILLQRFQSEDKPDPELTLPVLYVCGTAYEESVKFVKQAEPDGLVEYLSTNCILHPERLDQEFVNSCKYRLQTHSKLILAIDDFFIPAGVTSQDLRLSMAKATQWILRRNIIHELFIEGGSTATAILEELKISELKPVNEWQRGVVRMRYGNLYITVKPGSYALPDQIKQLFS